MKTYSSLRLGYNDNINLTTAPHDSVFESVLTPGIDFGARSEVTGVAGKARIQIQRFAGGEGNESSSRLDRENGVLNLDAYNLSETGMFTTRLEMTRDDSLETSSTLTGQVTERVSRDRLSLAPTLTRHLSQSLSLRGGYNFISVKFGNEVPASKLVEYDYHVFYLTGLYNFNTLTQGTVTVSYNRYEPEAITGSDTVYLQGGLSHEFSATLSGFFLAGIRRTSTEFVVPTGFCVGSPSGASIPDCSGNGIGFIQTGTATDEASSNGNVYTAGITYKHETGTSTLSASRLSTPSLEGGLLDTFNAQLASNYNFSNTLAMGFIASYAASESISNTSGGTNVYDVESFRAMPELKWKWSKDLSLSTGYNHVRSLDRRDPNAQVATRNAVFVTITYHPERRSVSR